MALPSLNATHEDFLDFAYGVDGKPLERQGVMQFGLKLIRGEDVGKTGENSTHCMEARSGNRPSEPNDPKITRHGVGSMIPQLQYFVLCKLYRTKKMAVSRN